MKFNFKIQQYQSDAVKSVIDVFKGQPFQNGVSYLRDIGSKNTQIYSQASFTEAEGHSIDLTDEFDDSGFKNENVLISAETLFNNVKAVQQNNNLLLSDKLVDYIGVCSLDVEMETGTGKTYVYIKTMYELNLKYGWSKFIVVVPSIAIREGVKKTFEITQDHFMEQYHKKIRFFVYNSGDLNKLDTFSSNPGINVMIINMQAFNTSLKEGGKSKESRIIYDKRDEFGSRRPIDVIKTNRPIIILDEPQKMGGEATQKALKNFNPLFCLNYSATHAKHHNLVYALDAVDAYNQRLVKKIEVKGVQVKNLQGTGHYLYLEDIIISPNKPPRAKMEYEKDYKTKGIKHESRIFDVDDNLYSLSNNMEQYKGYRVLEIDPISGTVSFVNGESIKKGEVVGDISEKDIRRIQIRETIKSHLEKEEQLFNKGIKTLSLFFIDRVENYRKYDEEGNEAVGEYGRIFEQEYNDLVKDYITVSDTPYQKYLKSIDIHNTHKGYFSIDKKGYAVDSEIKRGSDISDDISAYDLILKNKERLLSFDEQTRFIFSHSALREGWDNPNIFQICMLKHSDSITAKRQEVGRGLRLCVNQDGFRMDEQSIGLQMVHKINKLTVIASESYKDFVTDLQKQIKADLYERPRKASIEYFQGKTVVVDGKTENITKQQAAMIEDGNAPKILNNDLNENFYKKEFQTLWGYINHKYAYTVSFNSEELINKAIEAINRELQVSLLQYTTSVSEQKDIMSAESVKLGESFKGAQSTTQGLRQLETGKCTYDLIGKIAEVTVLTRKTVATILQGITSEKFSMYKNNPEEFISKVARLIREQKATMVVEHITYNQLEDTYDSDIFTAQKHACLDKALKVKKHIQPYVFTDGNAEKSVERKFAEELDGAAEVSVYAKLPKGFYIPTPVGKYSPDWAIAFNEGAVKHVYFVAETKGTMKSLQLRPIERIKISCARKLFNEISKENIVYYDVDSYQSLLNIMQSINK